MTARRKTLEIAKLLNGEFVWRWKSTNGQIISHGETYKRRASAVDGAILGSPVDKVELDFVNHNNKMWYYENGEIIQGNITLIDETEELGATEGDLLSTTTIDQIKAASGIVNMIGAGLKVLDDGHLVLNNHVYHPKHPDQDGCAIPYCQMLMEVEELIGSTDDGSDTLDSLS